CHLTFGVAFERQQIAGHTLVQDGPISFTERAFIARRLPSLEDAGYAVDAFNSAINPRLVHLPAGAIDPQPRFTVVQSRNDNIRPRKQSQSKTMDHVGGNGMNSGVGENISDGIGRDISFTAA